MSKHSVIDVRKMLLKCTRYMSVYFELPSASKQQILRKTSQLDTPGQVFLN